MIARLIDWSARNLLLVFFVGGFAAAAGVYASAALGILGTLIVFRVLGPTDAGRFSIVVGAVQFLSLLIELTSDDGFTWHRQSRRRDARGIYVCLIAGGSEQKRNQPRGEKTPRPDA